MHLLLHYVCCVAPKTTICSQSKVFAWRSRAAWWQRNLKSLGLSRPSVAFSAAVWTLRVGLCRLPARTPLQDIVQIKKRKYTSSTISLICIIMLTQRSSCLPSSINHKKKEQRSGLENKFYKHQFLLLEMLSLLPCIIKELWVSWRGNVLETL